MINLNTLISTNTLFDGRYKLLRPLSSDGGTADVWLALDTNTIDEIFDEEADRVISAEETGIQVAIKIYRPKNALDIGEQRFREEFKIVFNCHHTNLVQPINFSIYEGIPYLVLPFCHNGSSENLQGKITGKNELWKYIADVSSGLAYLHAFNPTIVHHDIKPANILIDDSNNFAITDFGISSRRGLNREGYDDTHSGTSAYMAPERFNDDYESIPESDIWSFGATLYELITGKVPFGEDGGLNQLENHLGCPPIAAPIPADIKRLISDCLSADPTKRPSAAAICKAAGTMEYPVKKKNGYLIGGAAAVIAAIIVLVISLTSKHDINDNTSPTISRDGRFEQAMELVNTPNAVSLTTGLNILDSLAKVGHIPSLYQLAYTYGWYSDSASVARKNLLGIDYYPEGTDEEWLPKSHAVNSKANGMLLRIEELSDSAYPEINANALYRLACYSFNDNKVFKRDKSRAESLLKNARLWAEKCNDTKLLKKIDTGLDELNLSQE